MGSHPGNIVITNGVYIIFAEFALIGHLDSNKVLQWNIVFVDHNFKVQFFTGVNIVFIFVHSCCHIILLNILPKISKCDSNDYKNARH